MQTGCKYHDDCFTCPFADCILNELEAAQQDATDGVNQEKKRSPRYEYNHKRYLANRKELLEKGKMYRERRKVGLPQKKENKTADWNEYHRIYRATHKDKEKARHHKYYTEHKDEIRARNHKYYIEHKRQNDGIDSVDSVVCGCGSDCQRKGHWKVVSDGYSDSAYICECSECEDTVWVYKDADRKWNFCPNCGADMRKV